LWNFFVEFFVTIAVASLLLMLLLAFAAIDTYCSPLFPMPQQMLLLIAAVAIAVGRMLHPY